MTRHMPASYLNTFWKSKKSDLIVEVVALWFGYKDGIRYEVFHPKLKDMWPPDRRFTKEQLEEKFTQQ